jgi:hypothetical protein
MGRGCLLVAPCAALAGCATTVSITPTLASAKSSCQIHAAVSYSGRPEYLPGALVADASVVEGLGFRYSYEAQYGLKEFNPALVIVNPLTLVGFPTGRDNLVVTGRVDLVRGATVIRSYAAAAAMKHSGSIFYEGETFTEMRRRGLLLVKDNLSAQLCQDQTVLKKLMNEQATSKDNQI